MNTGLDAAWEATIRRQPLPLTQLCRRAQNATTEERRHNAALHLWEATLQLLGSVAIVAYAERDERDAKVVERLKSKDKDLTRPSMGKWCAFVRELLPALAGDDPGFRAVADLIRGKTKLEGTPHLARLDAALGELQGLPDAPGRRLPYPNALVAISSKAVAEDAGPPAKVHVGEFFNRVVWYRNKYFAHTGLCPSRFYEQMGRALLAGGCELLGQLDVLAGGRLVYVAGVSGQPSGSWLVEWFELTGNNDRLPPLEVSSKEAERLRTDRIYLERPDGQEGRAAAASTAPTLSRCSMLHPLLLFDSETRDVLFFNGLSGKGRINYLCYAAGRQENLDELSRERRTLLREILGLPVDGPPQEEESPPEPERPAGPPAGSDKPCSLIGNDEYELLTVLGSGGMGEVHRAWQVSLGREVALKRLWRVGDAKADASLQREIRALSQVDHPHLVKIFTSGVEGIRWYYVMELIEGVTLASIWKQLRSQAPDSPSASSPGTDEAARGTRPREQGIDVSRLDRETWRKAIDSAREEALRLEKPLGKPLWAPDSAHRARKSSSEGQPPSPQLPQELDYSYVRKIVQLIRQVAEAVGALHKARIIHRDIKPGNIMLTGDGQRAMLVDLGLAQLAADEVDGQLNGPFTRSLQFDLTLRYASPQQLASVKVDERSDIYSLGATLWELLTLKPLYGATDETSPEVLIAAKQNRDPEPVRKHQPRIHPDLEAIVHRCLEKYPEQRYASAQELVDDLGRWLNDEPVKARRLTRFRQLTKFAHRNRRRIAAAAALLITGMMTVGTWSYFDILKARTDAEVGRRLAQQTVDEFLTKMSESTLINIPESDLLREQLLDLAVKKLRELQRQDGRPELWVQLGWAHYNVGRIQEGIGSETRAQGDYKQAIDQFERYIANSTSWRRFLGLSNPEELANARLGLAKTSIRQGSSLFRTGDLEEAKEAADKARAGLERLVAEAPDDPDARDGLADASLSLGRLSAEVGDQEQAYRAFKEAERLAGYGPPGAQDIGRPSGGGSGPDPDPRSPDANQNRLALAYLYQGPPLTKMGHRNRAGDLYEKARGIWEPLVGLGPGGSVGRPPADPNHLNYRYYLALAYHNSAELALSNSRSGDAQQFCRLAHQMLSDLAKEHPRQRDFRAALADSDLLLSRMRRESDDLDEAEEVAQRGLAAYRNLVQEEPRIRDYQDRLAKALTHLGYANYEPDPGRARGYYEEARDRYQRLAVAYPKIPNYPSNQAICELSLGDLAADARRPDEALDYYKKAEWTYQGLVSRHAEDINFKVRLGICWCDIGRVLVLEEQPNEAIEWLGRAIGLLNEAQGASSEYAKAREFLSRAHQHRALALRALGKGAEADDAWSEALRFAQEKPRIELLVELAMSAARRGDHAGAAGRARDLAKGASRDLLYGLAPIYGVCAKAALEDGALASDAERKDVVGGYVRDLIELLTKAESLGLFKNPLKLKALRENPDLVHLLDDPDYKAFLNTLGAEIKTTAQ